MLLREAQVTYHRRRVDVERTPIKSTSDVVKLASRWFAGVPQERFYVIFLNTKHMYDGHELISIGTLDSALTHPRDVFRTAIMVNCAAILLVHNHPSGSPEPSTEDKVMTHRLKAAADILGVELLDHIIIAEDGYVSFRDLGAL